MKNIPYEYLTLGRQLGVIDRHIASAVDRNLSIVGSDGLRSDFLTTDYLGRASQLDNIGSAYGAEAYVSPVFAKTSDVVVLESIVRHITGADTIALSATCTQANLIVMQWVAASGLSLVYDERVHASIRSLIGILKRRARSFAHNNVDDCARAVSTMNGATLIVTDGVFSISGECAPLADLITVCRRFSASLWLDDSHGFGVCGEDGMAHWLALRNARVPGIYVAGFSKAFGVPGALVLATSMQAPWYPTASAAWAFSGGVHRFIARGMCASLQWSIGEEAAARRARLRAVADKLVTALLAMGLTVTGGGAGIVCIAVPSLNVLVRVVHQLERSRVACQPMLYPAVGRGVYCVRMAVSAAHRDEQIEQVIKVMHEACA